MGCVVVGRRARSARRAPVILTLARKPAEWPRRQWLETGLLVLGTVVTTHVVFGQVLGPAIGRHPLEFVIFPFVIAAAVRLPPAATALVVLGASAVAIWNTVRGAGPRGAAPRDPCAPTPVGGSESRPPPARSSDRGGSRALGVAVAGAERLAPGARAGQAGHRARLS
jgi:predicted small secreted protein